MECFVTLPVLASRVPTVDPIVRADQGAKTYSPEYKINVWSFVLLEIEFPFSYGRLIQGLLRVFFCSYIARSAFAKRSPSDTLSFGSNLAAPTLRDNL